MNEREQQVLEDAETVLAEWAGHVDTHYRDCWKRHVACFAARVKYALDPEVD